PRAGVNLLVESKQLGRYDSYRDAVRRVMDAFGLSLSAAFPHVANCHNLPVPWDWQSLVEAYLSEHEAPATDPRDSVEIPTLPEGAGLRLERADGLSSRMAHAVAAGIVNEAEGEALLGVETPTARHWFREKIEAAATNLT